MPTSGDEGKASVGTASERTFRRAIVAQALPDETILSGVRFSDPRNGDVEADFLILMPGRGIAVVEVKGGDVSFADGQWHTTSRNNTRRIHPVDQARRAKHALRRYLDRQPQWPGGLVRAEWFVALPHTEVHGDLGPEGRRELLIGKNDLDSAMIRIRTELESPLNPDPAPDADAIQTALSLLLRLTSSPKPGRSWRKPTLIAIATVALLAVVAAGALVLFRKPQATAPGCHPDYFPCVPIANDLDCTDIKTKVEVIGGMDPYGLDANGDGTGCEIYG